MKSKALIAVLAAAVFGLFSSAVYAEGNSTANAVAGSGSTSVAGSNAVGNSNSANPSITNVVKTGSTTPADQKLRLENVPAVSPPALTSSIVGTCFGSASGGVSGVAIGLSFGSTKIDQQCEARLNYATLAPKYPAVAREIMCDLPKVRAAFKRVGKPCIEDQLAAQEKAKQKKVSQAASVRADQVAMDNLPVFKIKPGTVIQAAKPAVTYGYAHPYKNGEENRCYPFRCDDSSSKPDPKPMLDAKATVVKGPKGYEIARSK